VTRWSALVRALAVSGGASVLVFSGCDPEEGFLCGRVAAGSNVVRTCDRALEVCICATNSCARKVGIPREQRGDASTAGIAGAVTAGDEWGDCSGPRMTGYRYSEAPFARDDLAGKCVPPSALRLGDIVPSKNAPGPACPGQVENVAAPDASMTTDGGNEGGMSNGGAGGTGNAGAAGTAGNGGAGGMSGGGGLAGDAAAAAVSGAGGVL
jgi:hypothetical protein